MKVIFLIRQIRRRKQRRAVTDTELEPNLHTA